MTRFVKMVAVALAVLVGAVAAFFGMLVVGAILIATGLLALLGGKRFKVNVATRPASRTGAPNGTAAPPAGGDVIDVETRKVEPPPRELT